HVGERALEHARATEDAALQAHAGEESEPPREPERERAALEAPHHLEEGGPARTRAEGAGRGRLDREADRRAAPVVERSFGEGAAAEERAGNDLEARRGARSEHPAARLRC